GAVADGRGATVVLLDDSRSMALADDAGPRWSAALAAARATGADPVTLTSGESVPADELTDREPVHDDGRIVPALRAAIEGGARRIVLVTDGALSDAEAAGRLLASAGASLRIEQVGTAPVAN